MARRPKNPWTSVGEVLVWVLFAALLFPVGFAGWAVGHYTSLGKSSSSATVTRVETKTVSVPAPQAKPTTTTSAPTPTTTSAAAAGNAAAGKTVFASSSCASCHTFKPAGSTGTIGPDLDAAPAADAKKAGKSLAAFVQQSIVDPNAYVPKGYAKGIMPQNFGTQLSKTQLADLVAFVVSGSK